MDLVPVIYRWFAAIGAVFFLASGAYAECLAFTLGVVVVVALNRDDFFPSSD